MEKECERLFRSYKKLFELTMNPVFFTLASYIKHNNIAITLQEETKENELAY